MEIESVGTPGLWLGFTGFVVALLALDLGVFHRKAHVISVKEASIWSAIWIGLALCFNALVVHWFGPERGLEFLTGYLIEKALAVDNIFVIYAIFAYFAVPAAYQHRVLFWGILGALVMRGAMIGLGAALITRFDWIIYVFGGILILTAVRMLLAGNEEPDPEKSPVIRLARRIYPVTPELHGERFFVQLNGRRAATPLFLVLLMVESSDVLFAVDSIPAIFAVTQDPFLVFTSNIFAILGLRNLYFAIAPLLNRFKYLKQSLVFILAFVGVKMILAHTQPIPTITSLSVIIGILGVGILASALAAGRETAPLASPLASDVETLSRVTLGAAHNIIALAVGSTVLILGVTMIALPGPGLVVIPVGLAVLAAEFIWARRLLTRLREEVRSVAGSATAAKPE